MFLLRKQYPGPDLRRGGLETQRLARDGMGKGERRGAERMCRSWACPSSSSVR